MYDKFTKQKADTSDFKCPWVSAFEIAFQKILKPWSNPGAKPLPTHPLSRVAKNPPLHSTAVIHTDVPKKNGAVFLPTLSFFANFKMNYWFWESGANLENLKSKLFKVLSCQLQKHWVRRPCTENECQLRRGVNKINLNELDKSEILVVINHSVRNITSEIFALNISKHLCPIVHSDHKPHTCKNCKKFK